MTRLTPSLLTFRKVALFGLGMIALAACRIPASQMAASRAKTHAKAAAAPKTPASWAERFESTARGASTTPRSQASITPQTAIVEGDWLQASAEAVVAPTSPRAEARAKAIRSAEREARSTIRAHLAEVEIRPGVTVWQAMERDRYVWSKIMGMLNTTRSIEQTDLPDDRVQILMRIDLNSLRRICIQKEEAEILQ